MTVVNSFQRIQEYLLDDERVDYRLTSNLESREKDGVAVQSHSPPSQLCASNDEFREHSDCAVLRDLSGSWPGDTKPGLHGLSVEIARAKITMVVGPVGCGKSTFLKLLLGELPCASGLISTSYVRSAYCSQTPWVIFGTVLENVVGVSPWNRCWYDQVIKACALDVDLQNLPDGEQTRVGARGSKLSGGQQKRVVGGTFADCGFRPWLNYSLDVSKSAVLEGRGPASRRCAGRA